MLQRYFLSTSNLYRPLLLLVGLFFVGSVAIAQMITEQIIVDQLGWRPGSKKIVIFADPINGQNNTARYTPGTQFQVRRADNDFPVFTGTIAPWNSGKLHDDSGDKVWQGDFSSLKTPGSYYIFDPAKNLRSFSFEIKNSVYNDVLKASVRTFYYQRCGTNITAAHGGNWNHPTAHAQDATALLYTSSPRVGTTRDVSGGWYDAGDYNKYMAYIGGAMWDLMLAYELNPNVFSDNTNIPESLNSVPDLIDELKWELDWMLKMQATTGGVHNRVASKNYGGGIDDPSTDKQPRYYTQVTTWATATFAGITAHAARLFQPYATVYPGYATQLLAASEKAWAFLDANPNMSPASGTDEASLAASDGGSNANGDRRRRVEAAAELFKTTGKAAYKTYFESNYNQVSKTSEDGFHPFSDDHLDPSLCLELNRAYFIYCQSPGADASIVTALKTRFQNSVEWLSEENYTNQKDPYLAYMYSDHYAWGSNWLKANWAKIPILARELGVNPAKKTLYLEIAEEYLHYFHGRNPLSWVYLTNLGSKGLNIGAEKSVDEILHNWFTDGSAKYDGSTSLFGPAPGYLAGGPNKYYSGTTTPPKGQPPMKAYRSWNTGWPDPSWEVTEPAIYYQAAYTFLAAYLANTGRTSRQVAQASIGQTAEVNLKWQAAIHPNPVSQEFYLQVENAQNQSINITLTNLAGKTIAQRQFRPSTNNHQEHFVFDQHPTGLYLLQIRSDRQSVILRVLKQ